MEYDYAREQGIPVLGFVINASANWRTDRVDREPKAVEALQAFKTKIKQKMVNFWSSGSELRALFNESIIKTINLQQRRGWVRAPDDDDIEIARTLSKLAEENNRLRRGIEQLHASAAFNDDASLAIFALGKAEFVTGAGNKVTGPVAFKEFATDPPRYRLSVRKGTTHPYQLFKSLGLAEMVFPQRELISKADPLGSRTHARIISRAKHPD